MNVEENTYLGTYLPGAGFRSKARRCRLLASACAVEYALCNLCRNFVGVICWFKLEVEDFGVGIGDICELEIVKMENRGLLGRCI